MLIRSTAALAALFLAGAAPCAQAADKPTDPQIAHIAYTAGEIDIEAAKQAIKTSKNKEIVDFAKDMERDHAAVNKQALDLVKKLKVKPEDNPTSQALAKAAKEERAKLAKLKGAAFDKAYIDNEVAYHKQVDSALQTLLIPSASNAELKSLLETGLKIFQGHEQHAEHVAGMLKMRPASLSLLGALALALPASSSLAATIEVTIDKLVFSPASVEARVGDTIEWMNNDPFAHTATVKGGWNVTIAPKSKGRVTLKEAGAVDYFCRFHPNMKGHLDVKP